MTRISLRTSVFAYLFIGAIAFMLSIGGCSSEGDETSGGESPVQIGSILGLTGDYASYGVKMRKGFEVAIDSVNGTGGVNGADIDLTIEDSEFNPSKAVSAYRQLTGAEGINKIVGITGSKNAAPVCEAARSSDVVVVDALSTAPGLTKTCGENYFRVIASDSLAGRFNVEWALENGMENPAIVYVEDDWGASYKNAVDNVLEEKGITDVPSFGVTAGTRDFRSQVEKIADVNPDAIFLLLYARDGSSFTQQLRQAGVQATVYGSDNISAEEFTAVGDAVVEGVRVALPTTPEGSRYERFVQAYKSEYEGAPDANVIKSYDAMMVMAKALRNAGRAPSDIVKYLHSDSFSYDGLSGTIRFDENGDLASQEYSRMVYRDGELVPVEKSGV